MLIIVISRLINLVQIAPYFNLHQGCQQLTLLKYVTFGYLIYDKNTVILKYAAQIVFNNCGHRSHKLM